MRNYKHYPSTIIVRGAYNFNLNKSSTYESYLDKKARNIFSGWQKRYFVLLEGKIIIYTESKENKQVKGYISIKQISNIKPLDGNTFSIESEGRTFLLRAENQDVKNNWIEKIKNSFTLVKKGSLKDNNTSFDNKNLLSLLSKKDDKSKLNSISKKMGEITKRYGYILNKEDNASKLLLEKFGINKLINLNDKKILAHIHYGYMFKRQRLHETYNQRWFFLFSRSCLNNNEVIDNTYLEDKKQKDWLKFDTLYYFKGNEGAKESDNGINIYDAEIKMEECHKIINFEKNGKYFMNLDYKERIYEFYCETKMERDEWFEALINSRRTAKTYKFSITKHPKNVEELSYIFTKDKKSFLENIKSEIFSITGNTEEITEFNLFEFTINNLQDLIESYMDGCLCSVPIKPELLKAYVDYANREYLKIFKKFWEKVQDKIDNNDILKMGFMLLNFYDRVNRFNVEDINLIKNGKELIKIYFQKIFPNILFSIENTIKYVIEHKGTKDKEGLYYSEGPKILFDLFWKIFDLVKDMKHKITFDFLTKVLNISIFQYCFGMNCVLSNRGIIMEDEFLVTVSNDTLTLNELLINSIDNYRNLKIYTEEEIKEQIQIKKLIGVIDKLNNNAIVHLVYEHKDELEKEIKNQKFLKMDIIKIIKKSAEIYAKYKPMMNNRLAKIFYNEILKITLCYYITRLILIDKKKKRKREEILEKIKNDKEIFLSAYTDLIGQNLSSSTLVILDYIINILEIDKIKITTPIITIRQYIGPAFTYSVAKKLIKLRSDLNKQEKMNYINLCEEVLNGFESPKMEYSSYFQILSSKIKKNEKDKEYLKIRASQLKFGNEIKKDKGNEFDDDNLNIDNIKNNINDNSDYEEEIRNSIVPNTTREKNYIKSSVIDLMGDNEEIEDQFEEEEEENEIKEDLEEDSKIDYEGVFFKKRTTSFSKYFYQIKNCGLYWYEDQKYLKPENKISLEEVTVINAETDPIKFSLKPNNSKGGEKEYKFKCNTQEEKVALINAINKAKNCSKEIKDAIQFPKIEIKERKKVIKDYLQLNNKINGTNIEENIFGYLKIGKYFKIDKKKMQKAIKSFSEKKEIESEGTIKHKNSVKNKIKNLFKGK